MPSHRHEVSGPSKMDDGYHLDPITAQGMLDAFRDAELLAGAIDRGISGDLGEELLGYQRLRDSAAMPLDELTAGLADIETPPSADMQGLIGAIAASPTQISRFFGLMAGSVPVAEFFSHENLAGIAAGV